MNEAVLWFFNQAPKAMDLYEAVERAITGRWDDVAIKVDKTQITFKNRYGFAFVSLPARKVKGRPEACIVVSFGLEHEVRHPRIWVASEPYPNRWTHHVIVSQASEVDEELLGWISDAYEFSKRKAGKRKNE